ncbi:MAG: spondin domain-containing protein [Actinomycetota bacterium]
MRTMRRVFAASVAVAALVGAFVLPAANATPGDVRTYRVTVTNLTDGQPFTPLLFATHRANADVFSVGSTASFGVKEIAENGNLGPLDMALRATTGVSGVYKGMVPLVPAGLPGSGVGPDSVTFEISGAAGARRLSWVSMLICTNDGFTGLDSLKLPRALGESLTVGTAGYDAGTEINTEDFADIVGPCQGLVGVSTGETGSGTSNPLLAEGGVIHHHPGIDGGSDLLTTTHGWDVNAPVAEVTVERIV